MTTNVSLEPEGQARKLMAECGECGGLTTFGQPCDKMEAAQARFRSWAEKVTYQPESAAEGDYYGRLAVEALKPLFIACEMADERRMLAIALREAVGALDTINTLRLSDEVPEIIDPRWWKAASYDLQEMKSQGVSDDDPRIKSLLDQVSQGAYSVFEVGVDYRMKPTREEAKRLASIAESRKAIP